MKKWLYGTIFVAGLFLGDGLNILDNTINKLYYSQYEISKQTYAAPFDLHKEYKINENGELEVYFGDEQMYLVDENLRVNRPNVFEAAVEDGKGVIREVEDVWARFKKRYL